jgi:MoaA/NifB/PqqE/SkfB family radical SAM enzyme
MNPTLDSVPILILYPHSRCNCRCIMCDIWKDTTKAEISPAELERHLLDFERLSVQWVVLSGGEPLMHSDLFRLCALLRERHIRVTLLTTGLLLDRNAAPIVNFLDDVIVSLDGPAAIHDEIRRVVGAFALLEKGIQAIHRLQPTFPISARSTVQRRNYHYLRQTAAAAKRLGLESISFLAADVTSAAFNRAEGWDSTRQAEIALTESDIEPLEQEIGQLIREWGALGFVREGPEKLYRIVHHYRAHLGLCAPVAPQCNAPWVSAVIESDGSVHPCFFHKTIGNLHGQGLAEALNSPEAQNFRKQLNIAANSVCQRCVCSLNL